MRVGYRMGRLPICVRYPTSVRYVASIRNMSGKDRGMLNRRSVPVVTRSFTASQPMFRHAPPKRYDEHVRIALFQARSMTLTESEIAALLSGRDLITLIPPRSGEDASEYGCRAASELMSRYLLS